MITNSKMTLYHLTQEERPSLGGIDDVWVRYNYDNVWWFGGKGANTNKGYENANNVQIRIPYSQNTIDVSNISLGDIVVKGELAFNIDTQQDLEEYEYYNITAINNNTFGTEQHVHLSGK